VGTGAGGHSTGQHRVEPTLMPVASLSDCNLEVYPIASGNCGR